MKTAFKNGYILKGRLDSNGKMPIIDGSLLTEDGKIFDIIPPDASLKGMRVFDLKGKTIMPGLINAHVHLPLSGNPIKVPKKQINIDYKFLYDHFAGIKPVRAYFKHAGAKNALHALYGGVTTIRTVGGIDDFDTLLRNKIDDGGQMGPRILSAGTGITVKGGHFAGSLAKEADTTEEAAQLVRQIAATKPDLIKLMITGGVMDASEDGQPGKLFMPAEMIKAACDQAHALGLKVAAHVECTEGIKMALENGVDTIEHGAPIDDDIISLFKEKEAAHICTLLPFLVCVAVDPELRYSWELNCKNGRIVFDGIIECAKACIKAGIPVGLGTDSGCPFAPHYDMWRELVLFVNHVGVSPDFALYSATAGNAEILGIDHITGTLEPGKSADFIVVDDDPRDDLFTLRSPRLVCIRGKLIHAPKLKRNKISEREFDKALLDFKYNF